MTPLRLVLALALLVALLLLALTLSVALSPPRAAAQGYSPDESVRRMTPAEGLEVSLVAAEPLVRQPVAIEFDDRGRLWVIQYLQYPNPAGLKRVKVDRFSRTVYDRVPEPPPRGPKGADRVTILEDTDGDGRADRAKDFVSGLNLASGLAFGHGGVFIFQAPYLLFYPDRDADDKPDGDPDVLLSGFGLEDAHSVANSLTWGPDGWLYGCQGSTVTSQIRGVEFQQGVWRYHPLTRKFELFCEGGGNSWGLDFDRHGELLYSTNHGGFVALHAVQGGYYWKSFGKHGPLHNPHAYGYLDHVPHQGFKGGHVTVGGIVYQGAALPSKYRGKYLGADLLGHNVYWHDVEDRGSTFRTRHGGDLLLSNDTWFAPSDVTAGPDGAVYVADWHDRRTAHPDPDAEWDRSNGRVYRIAAKGTKAVKVPEWSKLSGPQLVAMMSHPDQWFVRRARRALADRRDPEVIFPLRTLVTESKDDQVALEALWSLYVSGGLTEAFAEPVLRHRSAHVRRWGVRLFGDDARVPPTVSRSYARLAEMDPDVRVRAQLACTAKRLPPDEGLALVERLLRRDEDGDDPYLPLLLWWAVERHAVVAMPRVTETFTSPQMWKSKLARDAVLPRLVRRYAAEGTEATAGACVRLLESAPDATERGRLLLSFEQGLQQRGNTDAKASGLLRHHLAGYRADDDLTLVRLLTRLEDGAAADKALSLIADARLNVPTRIALVAVLGEVGPTSAIEPLSRLLSPAREPEPLRLAALEALQRFDHDDVGATLLSFYGSSEGRLKARTAEALLGRKRWAGPFLGEIDRGRFAAKDVSIESVRAVALHQDRQLDALVRKHWGNLAPATPEVKLAEVRRLNNDLRAGPGDVVRGRDLFTKHCATCHRLFDQGGAVGPDLTHANRKDRDYLLVSTVDPSAVVRKEHVAAVVQTKDGRVLTGLIAEQTDGRLTLLDGKNERTVVPRDRIESVEDSPVSLMPENLLKELKPQEVRDLFAYLQSDRPPPDPRNRP